ncbi:ankyrin repeat and MYND domain-containing protein 1 [Anableps anableps]
MAYTISADITVVQQIDTDTLYKEGSGSDGSGVADVGKEKGQDFDVQEWPDGSKYEGEFVDGLKHGKGRYSWRNGESYEGFFYKDFKHGDGVYCWPTGHKFTGKFYLNRKEGYGQLNFPGGAIFQGLYHSDQRFGPGVLTYPDGRQDVGLWVGQHLLKLCSSVEEGFSLHDFPEYAAFMQPSVIEASLIQISLLPNPPQIDGDLLSDDSFILPPGIERYSTDGDHLPLPPARRRELDRLFHGELWEPDAPSLQGYEREPTSTLPLQVRMQAVIHKHRLDAENIGWDVAAVLSLNRDSFGPKGPLEVSSEQMIQHSFRGELHAVSQILQTGSVCPDVADSRGQTALLAATVNSHKDMIHLLLDTGADINKMNNEGMTALAVCHVLFYPFQSLHKTLINSPIKTLVSMTPPCESSPLIKQADFPSPVLNTEPQTTNTDMMDQNILNQLSEQESEEPHDHSNKSPAGSEHFQEEERKETGEDEGCKDTDIYGDEQSVSEDIDDESGKLKDEINRDVQDVTERETRDSIECALEVLDGYASPGSAQAKDIPAQQDIDKHLSQDQTLDSAFSVHSYDTGVTEETQQQSAETLRPQQSDSEETFPKMAALEIEHRSRLNTLNLLLERGADPNLSRVPMPVLFLAVMAGDSKVVRKLLLSGARTDIPLPAEKKGFYPLHVAAALPGPQGPEITELLLHAITDSDAQACDEDEIYEPDMLFMKENEPMAHKKNLLLKEGGRTALHIACQRESDYLNACNVVALLLSHRASTDLLWSGHSPLSLAIASGNYEAAEELLNGQADPNLPLGWRVGSALCTLANFNYQLGVNRNKLFEKLVKAGANILMPVAVGEAVGTAIDFAYYYFLQDLPGAYTPFYALNTREKEIFKARRHLLSIMADLLRQTVEKEQQYVALTALKDKSSNWAARSSGGKSEAAKSHRQPVFKFCYQCGRSVFVKLIACGRCLKVFFCSNSCKMKAWDQRHKEECLQMAASADVIQKSTVFKTQRGWRPLTVMKSRPGHHPLSITVKSSRALENQINLKENYSFI